MTNLINRSSILIIVVLMFLLSGCSKSFEVPDDYKDDDISIAIPQLSECKIIVTFANTPVSYDVTTPPLKYDKAFSLGFHLDDGAKDIFTHAFKLLNGGEIGGEIYDGLSYSDGCGNDIKFKMSTSIYSMANDQTNDIHNPIFLNNYYISWPELVELFKSGWGVYNHGLTALADIDQEFSIRKNHSYIKLMTEDAIEGGIEMQIFINPNGVESFSAHAFQQKYRIAYTESYLFGNPYFDIASNWSKSEVTMGRSLLENINLEQLVDQMSSKSINGKHQWGSVFTHSLIDPDHGYGFEKFKSSLEYIANTYGKGGLDNIWMTTEEEVLDYSILREHIVINQVLDGNVLEITFKGEFPSDLRYIGPSLILSSDADISSIFIEGASNSSFNGINTKTSLININFE